MVASLASRVRLMLRIPEATLVFWVENCARLPSQLWVCSVHFDESKESKLSSQSRVKGLAVFPPEAVVPPDPLVPPDALAPPEDMVPPEAFAPPEALLGTVSPPETPVLLDVLARLELPDVSLSPPRLPPAALPPVLPDPLPFVPVLLAAYPPVLDRSPDALVPPMATVPPVLDPLPLLALLRVTVLPARPLDMPALAPPSAWLPPAVAPPLLADILAVEPPDESEALSEAPEEHPTEAKAAPRQRTERKDNAGMEDSFSATVFRLAVAPASHSVRILGLLATRCAQRSLPRLRVSIDPE